MKRLFVAVPVSEEVTKKIKPLLSELLETKADLKLVNPDQLHFTLKFIGDVDEKKILQIEKKLAEIVGGIKPFEISLQGVGAFPSLEKINVVWIGAENHELISLMKIVGKELDFVKKKDFEEEVPHLTIARVKSAKYKEKLQEFVHKYAKRELGTMKVDKIILYESVLTREGSIYKVAKVLKLS